MKRKSRGRFGVKRTLSDTLETWGWIGENAGNRCYESKWVMHPGLQPPRPTIDSFFAVTAMYAPKALQPVFDERHWRQPPGHSQERTSPDRRDRREIAMQVALWTALGYYGWTLTHADESDLEKLLTFETRLGRNPRGGVGGGNHEGRKLLAQRLYRDLRRPAQGMDASEAHAAMPRGDLEALGRRLLL